MILCMLLKNAIKMQTYRERCLTCRKPKVTCFCHLIKPFVSDPEFVILIHPKELKIRVNSGRMAHLCLKNSYLIDGICFDDNKKVLSIIKDPLNDCYLLHPGHGALPYCGVKKKASRGRKTVFFVLDATWHLARKMYKQSEILKTLTKIEISPQNPSRFIIKKQPEKGYVSTIEAIYLLLEESYASLEDRPHQNLMEVFDYMVNQQVEWASTGRVRKPLR